MADLSEYDAGMRALRDKFAEDARPRFVVKIIPVSVQLELDRLAIIARAEHEAYCAKIRKVRDYRRANPKGSMREAYAVVGWLTVADMMVS